MSDDFIISKNYAVFITNDTSIDIHNGSMHLPDVMSRWACPSASVVQTTRPDISLNNVHTFLDRDAVIGQDTGPNLVALGSNNSSFTRDFRSITISITGVGAQCL